MFLGGEQEGDPVRGGAAAGGGSLHQGGGALLYCTVLVLVLVLYKMYCTLLYCTACTKVGALFVTIPEPIIGGIFSVMFGIITAVSLYG